MNALERTGTIITAMVHSRSEDDRVSRNLCRGSGSGLVVIFLPLEYAFVLLQLAKICVAVAVVDDRGPRTHHRHSDLLVV